uniref:ankyrin repeat and death domain-containing protein 1A-like n=1 Tax=Myxine glutinosa TaxID=7769 RepID=UPI00358F6209
MNALLLAAWFGHLNVVQLLICAGAKAACKNKNGLNIFHCAAQKGSVDILQFIIENFENLSLDKPDKSNQTATHLAAEHGFAETVAYLISCGASCNITDNEGNLPLHMATRKGHLDAIREIVTKTRDINAKNSEGQTALHLAALGGFPRCAQFLLSFGCDINSRNRKGMKPLHCAAQESREEVAKVLIDGGADVDGLDDMGSTAAHLTILSNGTGIMKLIIEANGDLNLLDNNHQSPLHLAAEHSHHNIADLILASGVNLKLLDKQGKSSLDIAARGNHINLVDMIIKADHFYNWEQKNRDVDQESWDLQTVSFCQERRAESKHMRWVLWHLATQLLKPEQWKELAVYWQFTAAHIHAIEQQWTGPKSYKEHGHRLLLIWFHGILMAKENPIKALYEALSAIDCQVVAEHVRRKANGEPESPRKCMLS